MYYVQRLATTVTGRDWVSTMTGNGSTEQDIASLEAVGVPVSTADCRSCTDPCAEGHDEYPKKFGADYASDMRGSVKPYRRQVLISTGQTNWTRDITDVKDSLATYLTDANDRLSKRKPKTNELQTISEKSQSEVVKPAKLAGVHEFTESTRLSILNGSQMTCSQDPSLHTVLVLPDYKAVCEVEASSQSAEALWKYALDPTLGPGGASPSEADKFKTWTLPYNCIILLCSHKKRDNRCAIAAPKLEAAFTHTLQAEGWVVDTQLEDLSSTGPPLEEFSGTLEERDEEVLHRLKSIDQNQKQALILKNSHMGGHKFAGNVIIYMPQGVSVWYGRVTPHEVDSIVKNTLIDGKVMPGLLRGGLNISKPGCPSLHSW